MVWGSFLEMNFPSSKKCQINRHTVEKSEKIVKSYMRLNFKPSPWVNIFNSLLRRIYNKGIQAKIVNIIVIQTSKLCLRGRAQVSVLVGGEPVSCEAWIAKNSALGTKWGTSLKSGFLICNTHRKRLGFRLAWLPTCNIVQSEYCSLWCLPYLAIAIAPLTKPIL